MTDRTPEQILAERMGVQRNGPASDGRGWFRDETQHAEIAASVSDLLADLAAAGYSIVRTDALDALIRYSDSTRDRADSQFCVGRDEYAASDEEFRTLVAGLRWNGG